MVWTPAGVTDIEAGFAGLWTSHRSTGRMSTASNCHSTSWAPCLAIATGSIAILQVNAVGREGQRGIYLPGIVAPQ